MMPITTKIARDIAMLAKLNLTDTERDQYTQQLNTILGYFEQLEQLDTSQVEGASHVLPLPCPLRDDEDAHAPHDPGAISGAISGAILEQAPETEQNYFLVPKIID